MCIDELGWRLYRPRPMNATIDGHRSKVGTMTATPPTTARLLPLVDPSSDTVAACGPDECAPTGGRALAEDTAATYAEWFATLADPTRVRLLHAVSTAPTGAIRVGELAEQLGISQSTCSHHVRKLAEV